MHLRVWRAGEHLRHLGDGRWEPMYDPRGNVLDGIEGKAGVCGVKADGSAIGLDFIRMQPGACFPLHTHEGDHEIYFISGAGVVTIDGRHVAVTGGHAIHIPAELPHAVWVGDDASEPLIFAAAGHPHHAVDDVDRMAYAKSFSAA